MEDIKLVTNFVTGYLINLQLPNQVIVQVNN